MDCQAAAFYILYREFFSENSFKITERQADMGLR